MFKGQFSGNFFEKALKSNLLPNHRFFTSRPETDRFVFFPSQFNCPILFHLSDLSTQRDFFLHGSLDLSAVAGANEIRGH